MKKRIISYILASAMLIAVFSICCSADSASSGYLCTADGKIDLLSYFQMEGVTAQMQNEAICFTLTAETASITYARPLTADGFSVRWNGVEDSDKKLDTIGVTISDIETPTRKVSLNYQKMNDEYCSVKCDPTGRTYLAAGAMYRQNSADISLYYSEEGSSFYDGTAFYAQIEKYLDGAVFAGFPSGAVNLRIDIAGKVGGSFCLREINGQRFGSDYTEDDSEPVLGIKKAVKRAMYQSVVTIPGVVAYDVLSSEASVTLTVKDPLGQVVTDINGTLLDGVDGTEDYSFRAEQFGFYNISYVTSDGINKSRSMGYRMNVMDTGGPVITIDKPVQALVVGQTYTFPKMTVTDNVDTDCAAWITVMHPSGVLTTEKDSFIPAQEGNYTIIFMAVDESGNVGRLTALTHATKGE